MNIDHYCKQRKAAWAVSGNEYEFIILLIYTLKKSLILQSKMHTFENSKILAAFA